MAVRASRACAALLAALCLNGCVAAAIPALAGAAMVRTETSGENATVTVEAVAAQPEFARSPAAQLDPGEVASPASALTSANVILGPAPAPTNPDPGTNAPLHDGYRALFDYAGELSDGLPASAALQSAMLKNPSALDGKRAECLARIPTVLIDLDAHNEPAVAASNTAVAPAFGDGLRALRDKGIEIAWISERSAAEAGDIRLALKVTGIDPEGEDRLILMRYPGDRKQTRRADLADTSCVIAIAGDNREDFDELYEYLVRPDAALGLELLIGKGWFLAPPVLGPLPRKEE